MPISEDEYDHHPGQPQHGMSKAEQRRSNKPIMEKRRRARINHCLNELKSLILDAMKKDPARHSKLEKADILEMTVKHLQSVQRQQLAVAVATDPAVLHKFKTGFNECAGEVSRYIGRLDGVEPAVKQRLVSHLAHCVSGLQQLTPLAFTAAVQPPAAPPPQQPASAPAAGDVNNNRGAANATAPPAAGLQLIPSRLPSGEFALLLPGGGNLQGLPFFPAPPAPAGAAATAATLIDRSHPSAFTAVDRPRRTPPPHGLSPAYQHPPPPLSPASSVSSGDDCSFTSEPYLSSSSPPLQPQLPAPASAPATPTPNSFKPPPLPAVESQPPSAPPPPPPPPPKTTASVGVGTVTEVKLEFKTIPMHGTAVFPIITTSPSPAAVATSAAITTLSVAAPTSVHQPLTVITTQPSATFKSATGTVSAVVPTVPSVTFCAAPAIKDPLDFSIKKDEHPHQQSASTQTTSTLGMKRSLPANFSITDPSDSSSSLMFASPNKIPRYSLHIKTETEVSAMHISPRGLEQPTVSTGGPLLKVTTPKHPYSTVGEDLTNKPSQSSTTTSTSEGASTSGNDASQAGNKDMWRPW